MSLMHREVMYGNTVIWSLLFALRVVVLAFLGSDYILPLVSLEFELTILALTSDTLMFTVFALWLGLSLLKSPRHLFNRVIVLIAYKKRFATFIYTHRSYWITVILAETFKPQSLKVNLWWLPIQSHLIPSAQLKRQHTLLELQSFWSQLQLPILSSSWVYFGVSYSVRFCFEVLYWVTYLGLLFWFWSLIFFVTIYLEGKDFCSTYFAFLLNSCFSENDFCCV